GSTKIRTGTGVLWSLAVEEHCYIVFPLLMGLSVMLGLSNRIKLFFAVGLCVTILLWRIYLVYALEVPEARTYYASDTRFDSILFGCILAFATAIWGSTNDNQKRLSPGDYAWLAAGFFILATTFVFRDPQ